MITPTMNRTKLLARCRAIDSRGPKPGSLLLRTATQAPKPRTHQIISQAITTGNLATVMRHNYCSRPETFSKIRQLNTIIYD
jgi:hypothetical protein